MRRRGRGWLQSSWDPWASQSAWQGGGLRERKGKRLCSTDSRAAKQTDVLSLSFSSCRGRRAVCSTDGLARPNEQGSGAGQSPGLDQRGLLSLSVLQRLPGERASLWLGWKEGSQLPLTRLEASRPPLWSRAAGQAGPAAGLSDAWPASKLTSEPSSSSDADAVFKTVDYWNNGCSPICSREMAFMSEAAWPSPR